jgi:hypothetical protein
MRVFLLVLLRLRHLPCRDTTELLEGRRLGFVIVDEVPLVEDLARLLLFRCPILLGGSGEATARGGRQPRLPNVHVHGERPQRSQAVVGPLSHDTLLSALGSDPRGVLLGGAATGASVELRGGAAPFVGIAEKKHGCALVRRRSENSVSAFFRRRISRYM